MDVFFADDSTQKGSREGMGSVIGLGGIFVEEGALRPLSAAVNAVAKQFGIPDGDELKWSPKKGTWIYERLHADHRAECYRQVLRAASGHNVRAIVVCWDTGRTHWQGKDAFKRCVMFLFERMTMHLNSKDGRAILIADRPGGGKKQEEEFLSDFVEHVQKGTQYVLPDRLLLNVLTTPSHLLRHLQIADLVTGIVTSMVCGNYDFAASLFAEVQPMLVRNNMGQAGGTGLKIFPRELINIYHWVLRERVYYIGGGAKGYALPQQGLPYYADEYRASPGRA